MTISLEVARFAELIVAAAATVSPRFFGLTAAITNPNPSDLPAVNESIEFIQPGIAASSPSTGRAFHCLTASATNTSPIRSLTTPTTFDSSPSLTLTPRASTTAPTASSPTIHPTANDTLFLVADLENNMRMTAMIGTGLIATPTANPRICPMTEPM